MFLRIINIVFLYWETRQSTTQKLNGQYICVSPVPDMNTDEYFNTQHLHKCPGILLLHTFHAN